MPLKVLCNPAFIQDLENNIGMSCKVIKLQQVKSGEPAYHIRLNLAELRILETIGVNWASKIPGIRFANPHLLLKLETNHVGESQKLSLTAASPSYCGHRYLFEKK